MLFYLSSLISICYIDDQSVYIIIFANLVSSLSFQQTLALDFHSSSMCYFLMDCVTIGKSNNIFGITSLIKVIMLTRIVDKIKKHKYKILAAVSFAAAGYFFYCSVNDERSIKLSAFLDALRSEQINEVVVKGDSVYFRSFNSDWYHSLLGRYPLFQLFRQLKATNNVAFTCEEESLSPLMLIPFAIPLAGIYVLYKALPQQYGKQNFKRQTRANTSQTFKDFYGGDKIKQNLKQVIEFIKEPEKYEKFGLRIRRGILLHGPPGTGKTMLARILANEAGLQFFSASASEFQQIFVGVGPKRIRDIFQKARKIPKGCIIFIDQIDAIGSRTQNWQTKEQRSTINQLLTQIDGFTQNNKIFVIGATNNISLVDSALLRPGRFDLKIYVPPPKEEDRAGILKILIDSKKIPHKLNKEQFEQISRNTDGWCGADLQNLLNESGYASIRKQEKQLSFETVKETLRHLKTK